MKILKIIFAICLILILVHFINANIPFTHNTNKVNEGKILLETKWGGKAFTKFAPDQNNLGCWSNAFAQIFFYHKLQPCGKVSYQCTEGYQINEDLDNYNFDWTKFENEITDSTSESSINEIAKYCYFSATIVKKDFGRNKYLSKIMPVDLIEKHINVEASRYFNYKGLLQSGRKYKNIVIREIEFNRPLFLYYRNMSVSGSGHAVDIDGYRFENEKFMVHLNFGWGGKDNGWFNFFESIGTDGDTELRILITVKPIA